MLRALRGFLEALESHGVRAQVDLLLVLMHLEEDGPSVEPEQLMAFFEEFEQERSSSCTTDLLA